MNEARQVPVQILGKEYVVACPAEQVEELRASARLLDKKMREIRDTGKVVGTERIAVIAALNIAHELIRQGEGDLSATQARLRTLQQRIEEVLADEDRQLKL